VIRYGKVTGILGHHSFPGCGPGTPSVYAVELARGGLAQGFNSRSSARGLVVNVPSYSLRLTTGREEHGESFSSLSGHAGVAPAVSAASQPATSAAQGLSQPVNAGSAASDSGNVVDTQAGPSTSASRQSASTTTSGQPAPRGASPPLDARQRALTSLAIEKAKEVHISLFPDDSDDLAQRAAQRAVELSGGYVNYRFVYYTGRTREQAQRDARNDLLSDSNAGQADSNQNVNADAGSPAAALQAEQPSSSSTNLTSDSESAPTSAARNFNGTDDSPRPNSARRLAGALQAEPPSSGSTNLTSDSESAPTSAGRNFNSTDGSPRPTSARRLAGFFNHAASSSRIKSLVLSGAPCAGKSSVARRLPPLLRDYGCTFTILVIPEVATTFMTSLGPDFNPSSLSPAEAANFQHALVDMQLDAERQARSQAAFISGPVLLLLDRGMLDFQAFCTADVWSSISSRLPPIHYDECVFLHSVAVDRANLYETESNPARCHSAEQSQELHSQLLDIWSSSSIPVIEVPTTECLEEKLLAVARRCYAVTGTTPPSDFDVDESSLREDLRGLHARRARALAQSQQHDRRNRQQARGAGQSNSGNPSSHGQSTSQRAAPQRPFTVDPDSGIHRGAEDLRREGERQAENFLRSFPGMQRGHPSAATTATFDSTNTSSHNNDAIPSGTQDNAGSYSPGFPLSAPRAGAPMHALPTGELNALRAGPANQPGVPASMLTAAVAGPANQLGVPASMLATAVPGASQQRWYLAYHIASFVMPRHCRELLASPPSAPATASFTITAAGGVTANTSTPASAEPIGDMTTFAVCERRWTTYILQFNPNYFEGLGGREAYSLYLDKLDELASKFGVSAAMTYDEGVRKAVFTGQDTMGKPVQSFTHFDIQLHQESFWIPRAPATDAPRQQRSPPSKQDDPSPAPAAKKIPLSDFSQNFRKSADGKGTCFRFNCGLCSRSSCRFEHICTRCGQKHPEFPQGNKGSKRSRCTSCS
jgi:hypothetical protein